MRELLCPCQGGNEDGDDRDSIVLAPIPTNPRTREPREASQEKKVPIPITGGYPSPEGDPIGAALPKLLASSQLLTASPRCLLLLSIGGLAVQPTPAGSLFGSGGGKQAMERGAWRRAAGDKDAASVRGSSSGETRKS